MVMVAFLLEKVRGSWSFCKSKKYETACFLPGAGFLINNENNEKIISGGGATTFHKIRVKRLLLLPKKGGLPDVVGRLFD
jgi:hypothetical protein